jgi:ferredoxin
MEIYYFSGTGNSLFAARELQNLIPGSECLPIVSLAKNKYVKSSDESVGFIFPIYTQTIPLPVVDFIKKINLDSAKYIFAVSTQGGGQGNTINELNKLLKKKKKCLDSYFVFNTVLNMPFIKDFNERVTDEKIFNFNSIIRERIASIKDIIVSGKQMLAIDPQYITPVPYFFKLIGPYLIPLGRYIEKKFITFYCDNKCTGCGTCEKVCLSGTIKLVDNKPLWQKKIKCYQCHACMNFCPEMAIQNGSNFLIKSYSDINKRYVHPEINADDIAGQKSYPNIDRR